jgi:hypothetical protein
MAAGWPTKVTYANGDVFSASDINDTNGTLNYIDPTSATNGQVLTRDSASPGKVKWAAGGGKVLQVVSATYSTSVAVFGTTYGDSGLSLSITPALSTSKVLVLVNQTFRARASASATGTGGAVRLLRASTTIYDPNPGAYEIHYWAGPTSGARETYDMKSLVYLDSPATTSSTTYKTQIRGAGANDNVYAQDNSAVSVITLLEIGA